MSLSASGPLACENVRQQLSSLIDGGMDAERRGRIVGHIASCAECAAALGDRVAAAIVRGDMAKPAGVSLETAPSVLFPAPRHLREAKVGIMWQRGTSCRTLHPEERRAMERAKQGLQNALSLRGARRGAVRVRGAAVPVHRLQEIHALDTSWNPVAGAGIRFEIVDGPRVTSAGFLELAVEISAEDCDKYRGRTVICTLAAGGEKISFEAAIDVPVVEFAAEGLPELEGGAEPDAAWLEFYLAPAEIVPE